MNRMDVLNSERRDARQLAASGCAARIIAQANAHDIEITLFGSLARGDFREHSDIDLLVRGPIDTKRRLLTERLVANEMRGTGIPYDLVFEADMQNSQLQEMLNEFV